MAALSTMALVRFSVEPQAFVAAFACSVLVALAAIDLDQRILPNRIVLPAAAVVLVAQIALSPSQAPEWLVAALGAAFFLALPLLFNPNGMGLGDVKLALLLGAWLGAHVLPALLVAFMTVVPVSLFLLVRHGGAARKRAIAFGPFLAFGAILIGLSLGS
jgi:leader peptidase (prepilin peptidase)/N-methyltransferase